MKYTLLVAMILAAACAQQTAAPQPATEIRTIENTPIQALPPEPLQTIDQPMPEARAAAPAATSTNPAAVQAAANRAEELSRKMNLPFAPAIAMDPVDGSKVSIMPTTPMAEHKNRLYYFSSTKNKQAFAANPDAYLKEKLASY